MKVIWRTLRFFYSLYAIILFIALLLVIFPFVLIASIFGKIRGGNLIYRICSVWADAWFLLIGMRAKVIRTAGLPLPGERYIFVANHVSYMDIPMIVKVIRQPLRALGKAEIGKIPIFGFLYRYGAIQVDRSSPEARKKSVLQLKSVLSKGISVFIFPEGTFNMTTAALKDFYDGAFRIAIETQTPILPVIFPDSSKRLQHTSVFSFTPGLSRAIFLEAFPVNGLTSADVVTLKNRVHSRMAAALEDAAKPGKP